MDDLSSALTEYGVHVKKPDFYTWNLKKNYVIWDLHTNKGASFFFVLSFLFFFF